MSRRTQAEHRLVNWFDLLTELARAGLSNAEVARRLGVHPATVHMWKHGSEPSYSDGVRLVALHAESLIPAAPFV